MKSTKQQIDTLFGMAKERGLSPMWTHFYRETELKRADPTTGEVVTETVKSLAATACILLDAELNPVSRGLSLVSLKDNGDKAYGRLLSLKRAYNAAASEGDIAEETLRPPDGYPVESLSSYGKALVKASRRAQELMTDVEDDRIKEKKKRIAAREAAAKKAAAAAKKATPAKKTGSRKKAAAGAVA